MRIIKVVFNNKYPIEQNYCDCNTEHLYELKAVVLY